MKNKIILIAVVLGTLTALPSIQKAAIAAGTMPGAGQARIGSSFELFMSKMPVHFQNGIGDYLGGRIDLAQLHGIVMMPNIEATLDPRAANSIQNVVQGDKLTQEQAEKLLGIVKTVSALPSFPYLSDAARGEWIKHGQAVADGASKMLPADKHDQILAKVERMILAMGMAAGESAWPLDISFSAGRKSPLKEGQLLPSGHSNIIALRDAARYGDNQAAAMAATEKLIKIGGNETVAALRDIARYSEYHAVKVTVADELAKMTSDEAIDALYNLARYVDDHAVQVTAVDALAKIGTDRVVPALKDIAIYSGDFYARYSAKSTLALIGTEKAKAASQEVEKYLSRSQPDMEHHETERQFLGQMDAPDMNLGGHGFVNSSEKHNSDFMIASDMMRPSWEREAALGRMHPSDAAFWSRNAFGLPSWVRNRFSRDKK